MMNFKWLALFLVVAFYLGGSSTPLFSAEYSLFDKNGMPALYYDHIVKFIKAGDVLKFNDGKSFTVGAFLGEGKRTKVYEILDNSKQVIRIPLSFKFIKNLESTHIGYLDLLERGVPIVKILSMSNGQYIISERVGKNIKRFEDMVSNNLTPAEQNEMEQGLYKFIKTTATFASIGDLRVEQMVYDFDKHSWVLLDWTHGHKDGFIYSKLEQGFVASPFSVMNRDFFGEKYLRIEMSSRVAYAREMKYKWIENLWYGLYRTVHLERQFIVPHLSNYLDPNSNQINYSHLLSFVKNKKLTKEERLLSQRNRKGCVDMTNSILVRHNYLDDLDSL